MLTGSPDAHLPPASHFDALVSVASEPDSLPRGMRLLFIIGATLAHAAHGAAAADLKPDPDDTRNADERVQQLRTIYLQGHRACETLRMPPHLQQAFLTFLCDSRQHAGPDARCGAVQSLIESLLKACVGLLSPAPPVLLPAQRGVGHVLASGDQHHRRVVVAARLRLERGDARQSSSFAEGIAVVVELAGNSTGGPKPHLGVYVRVDGACEQQLKCGALWVGVVSSSESAVTALADAAVQWCSGDSATLIPQRHLWLSRPCGRFVLKDSSAWGHRNAFAEADCAALGCALAEGRDAVAYVSCEWAEDDTALATAG